MLRAGWHLPNWYLGINVRDEVSERELASDLVNADHRGAEDVWRSPFSWNIPFDAVTSLCHKQAPDVLLAERHPAS